MFLKRKFKFKSFVNRCTRLKQEYTYINIFLYFMQLIFLNNVLFKLKYKFDKNKSLCVCKEE